MNRLELFDKQTSPNTELNSLQEGIVRFAVSIREAFFQGATPL